MSALEVTALVFTAVWLGVVSLAVLLLVRQVGVLTVRLDVASRLISPAKNGLPVGTAIPRDAATELPQLQEGVHYLLALSSTCDPCRELVARLDGNPLPEPVIALVSGPSDRTEGFVALLPPGVQVIRDPEADSLLKSLQIETTPFAVEVKDGAISGNAVLTEATDLQRLMEAQSENGRSKRPVSGNPEVSAHVGSD
jgi:hypothetical protein